MSSDDSAVVGVLLLTRHGDRSSFYQDPDTYDGSDTQITPLGEVQEYQLGTLLRSKYFDPASTSFIRGINNSTSLVDYDQVLLEADASDEGYVILDSAFALSQGLWPANSADKTTLANGTTIDSPLGGYQYVPIQSIDADEDVSLEGWSSCPKMNTATNEFYNSAEFQAVSNANTDFLANLTQIVNGRPVNLQNMWNIFDYMNVQSIHNKTFLETCPPNVLAQARTLANYHEAGVFSSSNPLAIQNVGGQAILPPILTALNRLANSSDPLKFQSVSISYKPFLSLFQMLDLVSPTKGIEGIINYAGSTAFEVRASGNSTSPFLRVLVKNGTNDNDYVAHNVLNATSDIPLSTFVSKLEPYALNARAAWCSACGNNSTRECDLITALNHTQPISASHHDSGVSKVGAGFIGAGVTLAVVLALLGLAALSGFVAFGSKGRSRSGPSGAREKEI